MYFPVFCSNLLSTYMMSGEIPTRFYILLRKCHIDQQKKYKLSYLGLSEIPGKKAMEVAEIDFGRVLKTVVGKS